MSSATTGPADFTLVNGQRVPNMQELQDGDRIQLGNVLLKFQARAAKKVARGKKPRRQEAATSGLGDFG